MATQEHEFTLFANTGVQILSAPVGRRVAPGIAGEGWRYCRCKFAGDRPAEKIPYVLWQVLGGTFFLAVDTTLGDPEEGHIERYGNWSDPIKRTIAGIVDSSEESVEGLPPVTIVLRPAETPVDVHLVVDLGNSRTGALLMEVAGDVKKRIEMLPFQLVNRFQFDAWRDGEFETLESARWFSSRTCWCTEPYLEAERVTLKEFEETEVAGWIRKRRRAVAVERQVAPRLFEDFSLVRMGKEVEDLTQMMCTDRNVRTGLSSPKRYLWADDDSWLENAQWSMAFPFDKRDPRTYEQKLRGRLLNFVGYSDGDELIGEKFDGTLPGVRDPHEPHVPRVVMIAAVYELMTQAYALINSHWYRQQTGNPGQPRRLSSLTLTYPSGMLYEERHRFQKQAAKAAEVFARTVGRMQGGPGGNPEPVSPKVTLRIDEASAVHLTYIWAELRKLGMNTELWFDLLARDRSAAPSPGEQSESTTSESPEPSLPDEPFSPHVPARRRRRQRVPTKRKPQQDAGAEVEQQKDLRIACIDIGGGTTDMMIARYWFEQGVADCVFGEMLHRNGISVAGDRLMQRLLECVIVPEFANALGLDPVHVGFLFGPENPINRKFRLDRINWMNRLFVPLGERYLQCAVDDNDEQRITHTDPEVVSPEVVRSLERVIDEHDAHVKNDEEKIGPVNVEAELELYYDQIDFEEILLEVFGRLLRDFCARIIEHQSDVVLLAGRPSKLKFIQEMVRCHLPLHESRVVPLHMHYAGNWYPYQIIDKPGAIVDPKSAVVVGAALEFLSHNGALPQFRFKIQPCSAGQVNRFYWGTMSAVNTNIPDAKIIFRPDDTGRNTCTLTITQPVVILGRKIFADEDCEAAPIYLLRVDRKGPFGQVNVKVEIIRDVNPEDPSEEILRLGRVEGTIGDNEEPAVEGENVVLKWRTMTEERFFLDTGGLDRIMQG